MVNREVVDYLFDRILAIWGANKFNAEFGNLETLAKIKREWAAEISQYSESEIDDGLNACKRLLVNGDNYYRYPSIVSILERVKYVKNQRPISEYLLPEIEITSEEREQLNQKRAECMKTIKEYLDG